MSDFQANASRDGNAFEQACIDALERFGFLVETRVLLPDLGIEVDAEIALPDGRKAWIECKGTSIATSTRPGCERTDTMKKAICNGALIATLADPPPFVVLTSNVPERNSAAAMLVAALDAGYLADCIAVNDPTLKKRLIGAVR